MIVRGGCLLFVYLISEPQKLMTFTKNRKFSKKHFFKFFLFFIKNAKFKTMLNEPQSTLCGLLESTLYSTEGLC